MMKDDRLVQKFAAKIVIKVSKELTLFVSSANKSLFRDPSIENLCNFNWFTLMDDFRRTNPVLCDSFLRKPDKEVVLSVIAGMLLKIVINVQISFRVWCPCCIQVKLKDKLS